VHAGVRPALQTGLHTLLIAPENHIHHPQEGIMRNASFTATIVLAAGFGALTAMSALSADISEVKVSHDREFAARTNMDTSRTEQSSLGVTFDEGFTGRTNMKREATDVSTVKVAPDMTLRERTNMGDLARNPPPVAEPSVSAKK
jgi:hypothetical protein